MFQRKTHEKENKDLEVHTQKKRKPISYCEFPIFRRKKSVHLGYDMMIFGFNSRFVCNDFGFFHIFTFSSSYVVCIMPMYDFVVVGNRMNDIQKNINIYL